jgi:hypothetical protein
VTVPYLDVSEALGDRVEGLRNIDINENDRIRVTTASSLWYEFGFDLKCLYVNWGHNYIVKHEEMVEAGKLTSVLGDGYREARRKDVRYWNGSEWTAEPARNSR